VKGRKSMRHKKIILVVKSHPLSIALISIFLTIAFFTGCQKTSEEKKTIQPTVTIENLHTAYAKEMNRHKMYDSFTARALKDKMKNVAQLYRALARSEEIHALNHIKLLKSLNIEPRQPQDEPVTVGTTLQTLKMALSMEEIECGSMYPSLIRTAELEKQPKAVKQFQIIQDADSKHGELLRYAVDRGGDIPPLKYLVCPGCGYVLTTEQTDECPACKGKVANFEKI